MAMDPDLACGFFKNIGDFWQAEEFSDLKVNIGDYQFNCHRFHICACSAFFRALLQSENKDSFSNHVSHITIKGISPDTFALVLKAVYKSENLLDKSNMIDVWHAAHELQIDVLVSKCEDFVTDNLALENYENIFQSALLLGSARVLESVVKFMAQNFETFTLTHTFLELPAKFVEDIVESTGLVVESHDHLVDSILQWVKHVPEFGDEHDDVEKSCGSGESAGMLSKECRSETSEMGNDQQGKSEKEIIWTEVMFTKPPLPMSDTESRKQLRQAVHDSVKREESIGQLLKKANLVKASKDYLEKLRNDDWLMGIKQARDVVWETLLSHSMAGKSTGIATQVNLRQDVPEDVLSYDHERVVIFKAWKSLYTYHAYSLETNKIYEVSGIHVTSPEYQYLQCTYISPLSLHNDKPKIRLEGKNLITPSLPDKCSNPVFVDNFLYCFTNDTVYRLSVGSVDKKQRAWIAVWNETFYGTDLLMQTTVLGDKIILLYHRQSAHCEKYSQIHCFNTSTRMFHRAWDQTSARPDYCFFFHKQCLYMLQGSGELWTVSEADGSSCAVTKYCSSRLWHFCMPLYGAAVYSDELVIFVKLPSTESLPKPAAPLNLKRIRFVQLLTDSTCHHVVIPKTWLIKEV